MRSMKLGRAGEITVKPAEVVAMPVSCRDRVGVTAQTPTWFSAPTKPFENTPEPGMAVPHSRYTAYTFYAHTNDSDSTDHLDGPTNCKTFERI